MELLSAKHHKNLLQESLHTQQLTNWRPVFISKCWSKYKTAESSAVLSSTLLLQLMGRDICWTDICLSWVIDGLEQMSSMTTVRSNDYPSKGQDTREEQKRQQYNVWEWTGLTDDYSVYLTSL